MFYDLYVIAKDSISTIKHIYTDFCFLMLHNYYLYTLRLDYEFDIL